MWRCGAATAGRHHDRRRNEDGFAPGADCNDADAAIHPDAAELCNATDDDCDGDVDEDAADAGVVFTDGDSDGYGGDEAGTACVASHGQSSVGGDCDDGDPRIHPGAIEVCNAGIDDDCNGLVDDEEGVDATDYYEDADHDGFGAGAPTATCDPEPGFVPDGSDCNDADDAIHPGAKEICNGVDDDCDATTPETEMVTVNGDVHWTIQQAVDAADDEDTVFICDGTFYENLVITRSVVLEGMGADVSVIDGSEAHASVVGVWNRGIDLTVRGLTIQNGSGDDDVYYYGGGGGIQAWDAGSLTIVDSVIADNQSPMGAGVMGPDRGDVLLVDSTFTRNESTRYAGGAYLVADGTVPIEIRGCAFLDNTAVGSGAGLSIEGVYGYGDANITDTVIDGNVATGSTGWTGGGFYVYAGTITLSGVTISNNQAPIGAGADVSADVVADDTTIVTGNVTSDGGMGGGIYLSGSWTGGTIENNTAGVGGGANLHTNARLDGVVVEANHATEIGGGVYVWTGNVIETCVVNANTTDGSGAGIGTRNDFEASATVRDSTITANVAKVAGGGASARRSLRSDNTDWGSGASDNDPDDIFVRSSEGGTATYDAFGAAESFTCAMDAVTCE